MRSLALFAAVLLAACSPAPSTNAPTPPAASAPAPSTMAQQTFAHCTWGEVQSAGVSVWSFACPAEFGNVRLVADEAVPGFDLEQTDSDGVHRRPAIRIFTKAPDAPLDSIFAAVRAASPGPATAACTFEPAPEEFRGSGRVVFAPTGAAKDAWTRAINSSDPGTPPCGDLGVSMAGVSTFEVVPGAAGKVAFVNWGSEIQIFDPNTLRASR